MNVPISIFILDVSNSSTPEMGEKLTVYLDEVVDWITCWTEELGPIQIKHRAGDEIIFVGPGYSTAYTLAFFVSRVWKYKKHMPYFGLAFGDIDKEVKEVDLEKWIHPLVKQARYANDLIKQEKNRMLFKFELDQFYPNESNDSLPYHQFRNEFETLINALIHLQLKFIQNQTEIQEIVCTLFLILKQQKGIAKILGRTAPTISSHFKKGNSEEILDTFSKVISILHSLQEKAYPESAIHPAISNENLTTSIRTHLQTILKTLIDT
ncbi:hypothetical protein [Neobacillus sp. SuZ13]|uniref:hypothetical protein n=1 Tax=Neobacillus sp. SuZ13 TaxID=3047875 RepID=UPI0024BFFABF|nr:hypothetical protein [Neobacillus sp. SuZ13]WHY64802.1 hypothetical protein QNH17_16945 [Neobacillus sp. SuZ13]